MAIIVSKRLLRVGLLAAVCMVLVLFLGKSTGVSESSSRLPDLTSWSGSSLFGGSQSTTLTPEEEKAEEDRRKAEELLAGNHDDPNALPIDEQVMDEAAKALQDSSQKLDGKEKEEALKDPAAGGSKPDAVSPVLDPARDVSSESAKDTKALGATWEFMAPSYAKKGQKPKAAFVVLVRNSELYEILPSIKNVEAKFNHQFNYPWVFFNEEPFTEEFREKVQKEISSEAEFGLIPKEHWSYPDDIDQEKAATARAEMESEGVIYGGLESYRHMCRFQSGFFWQEKLLEKYDWYWRVEPNTKLYCDIDYDVFQWMQDNDKVYGFTITIHEYERTIRTLWDTVKEFLQKHPSVVSQDNLMKFISNDGGNTYNLCHFWSNFEVANLNFWRSPAYRAFFEYLDKSGGFFYERWGDAPVHSIAASLFLPKDKLHYFSDIGYHHNPYNNCPLDKTVFEENNCECDQDNDFTFQGYSCGVEYYDAQGMKKPKGWKKYRQ